jgi:hypothetical protein
MQDFIRDGRPCEGIESLGPATRGKHPKLGPLRARAEMSSLRFDFALADRPDVRRDSLCFSGCNSAGICDHQGGRHTMRGYAIDLCEIAVLGISPGMRLQSRSNLRPFEPFSVARKACPLAMKDRATEINHSRGDRARVRLGRALWMERERSGAREHRHRYDYQERSHSCANRNCRQTGGGRCHISSSDIRPGPLKANVREAPRRVSSNS